LLCSEQTQQIVLWDKEGEIFYEKTILEKSEKGIVVGIFAGLTVGKFAGKLSTVSLKQIIVAIR
jgi:rRNA pseudouridine-1189 N-methylase Emg1 (Nep1/Mra1 family)